MSVDITTLEFTGKELDLVRQWFDAVQDVSPGYLETADFRLAKRIYAQLGLRVPATILARSPDD
jgi:hypothetical protein